MPDNVFKRPNAATLNLVSRVLSFFDKALDALDKWLDSKITPDKPQAQQNVPGTAQTPTTTPAQTPVSQAQTPETTLAQQTPVSQTQTPETTPAQQTPVSQTQTPTATPAQPQGFSEGSRRTVRMSAQEKEVFDKACNVGEKAHDVADKALRTDYAKAILPARTRLEMRASINVSKGNLQDFKSVITGGYPKNYGYISDPGILAEFNSFVSGASANAREIGGQGVTIGPPIAGIPPSMMDTIQPQPAQQAPTAAVVEVASGPQTPAAQKQTPAPEVAKPEPPPATPMQQTDNKENKEDKDKKDDDKKKGHDHHGGLSWENLGGMIADAGSKAGQPVKDKVVAAGSYVAEKLKKKEPEQEKSTATVQTQFDNVQKNYDSSPNHNQPQGQQMKDAANKLEFFGKNGAEVDNKKNNNHAGPPMTLAQNHSNKDADEKHRLETAERNAEIAKEKANKEIRDKELNEELKKKSAFSLGGPT